MFLPSSLFIFIELILLLMIIVLLIVKIMSGKSLIKINNLLSIVLFILGIICFTGYLYILFFQRSKIFSFHAITLIMLSLYLTCCSITIRNSICEKGIIIFDNFPILVKWNKIQKFAITSNRIYFKKRNGYGSMIISKHNLNDIQKILSKKINRVGAK